MPERKAKWDLAKDKSGSKVREAAVEYNAYSQGEPLMTTVSSKNQITLPVQLLRELGIGPGDRLAISREGNKVVLRARPKDWVQHYAGSVQVYGRSKEEIDQYVRDLRAGDDREEKIERAWSGPESASRP